VTPVIKDGLIALLDPAFRLAGADFLEKLEYLAFGPDFKDGCHLLIVTGEDDFMPTQPSRSFAFAMDRNDRPAFQPQNIAPRFSRECLGQNEHS
jgi:hypothetical protein